MHDKQLCRLLLAQRNPRELRSEWQTTMAAMARPWSGDIVGGALDGHVPHDDLIRLLRDRHPAVEAPGVYVWGAWRGGEARIQYVGIAHDRSIRERFETRYRDEWARTLEHANHLRRLPENFSPRRESVRERERRYAGIRDSVRWSHRLQRAERYAKIGFQNLWYFTFPSADHVGSVLRGKLKALEADLIQSTNRFLFDEWVKKSAHGFPLLNKTHFRVATPRRPNPHCPNDVAGYDDWLDGQVWWSEWDRECGVMPSRT